MFISLCTGALSASNDFYIDINDVEISYAVRLLAKILNTSVIISPDIKGKISLHLKKVHAESALKILLASHGLERIVYDNVWVIAPRTTLIAEKEEQIKWQEVREKASPMITKTFQINYAVAMDIATLLQTGSMNFLSPRGKLSVDGRTNRLCVQDTESKVQALQRLLHQLDVPIKQIRIEAKLVSIDKDYECDLGVDFALQGVATNTRETKVYSLAIARLADQSLLDIRLNALEKTGHAELISTPSLFTQNRQSASIEAGEEVPYQEVSESGGTAVAFKKAVLGLKVTPELLPGDKVLLQLQINQDRPSNKMVLGVPTISTRKIETRVLVKTNETLVLGGIYESNQEHGEKRLPFMSKIPFIGWLFIQRNVRENKRELLIFVTPKVVT